MNHKIIVFIFCLSSVFAYGQSDYAIRKADYIERGLSNLNNNAIIFQAYKNQAVNQQFLDGILNSISSNTTADFDIVKLIRILFLSHGEYDSSILATLNPIPFWLTKNENLRVYWSENHMIMWMSSDWLLHEKYNKPVNSNLRSNLVHFLNLKINYGFYEFFSSVYLTYCLSGLLNLADFSQDAEIKNLASQAAQRLLKDLLLLTNNKGVFFPAAGRNYYGKYRTPYQQNHNDLIFLLLGKGEQPNTTSHSGSFLATSTLDVSEVIASWKENLNFNYTIGHSLKDGINIINKDIEPYDKTIFQWSSGAYFHPDVALSTATLLKDYNLWEHLEFNDFKDFKGLPVPIAPTLAELASVISKSSCINQQTIAIFKNKSVTLSSIQDFWKGKNGYQQFPIVVNTGTSAVFTLSGKVYEDWNNRPELHANTHLPFVKQQDNIALVQYRPEKGLELFGYTGDKLNVGLHWNNSVFDEIREDGNWILGKENDGFVAVRRFCTNTINNVMACDNTDAQTWIFIVGNEDMYGSFDNFEQLIKSSQYEEKWFFNLPTLQWAYYSKITIDGKTLENTWYADIFSGPKEPITSINKNIFHNSDLKIFPNPASDFVNISLPNKNLQHSTIQMFDMKGQTINIDKEIIQNQYRINTSQLQSGQYIIQIKIENDFYNGNLLIK